MDRHDQPMIRVLPVGRGQGTGEPARATSGPVSEKTPLLLDGKTKEHSLQILRLALTESVASELRQHMLQPTLSQRAVPAKYDKVPSSRARPAGSIRQSPARAPPPAAG